MICFFLFFLSTASIVCKTGVYQVASLSENYAKKIYRKSPTQLLNYNHHNLLRIYPAPTRLQSSNFNPILFWVTSSVLFDFILFRIMISS